MDAQENLRLRVANFGPIAKADIDLRPLTVFVGPSNTGKSYLAILIYALHKFFSGRQFTPLRYRIVDRTIFNRRYGFEDPAISPEEFEVLQNWIKTVIESKQPRKEADTSLPEPIADIVRSGLSDVALYSDLYATILTREFGIEEIKTLIRNRVIDGTKINISRSISGKSKTDFFNYEFLMNGKAIDMLHSISDKAPLRFEKDDGEYFYRSVGHSIRTPINLLNSEDEDTQYLMRSILSRLIEVIRSSLVNPLASAAYYLPADRTGVMHAHRVVVGSIIAQAPRAGLQYDTPLPQLSGVLADFLEQLIGLEDRPMRRRPNGNLASQIEKHILQGEVSVERSDVGYPEFFYRPIGWKHEDLRLMNTSSMVSELAPIVLYLRHVVRPGEVLIIEEPESHLHPKMQVELTRHLAAAVKAGVRIMITTHSEWILDELANLIYISDLPKSKRSGIAGADQALEPKEVGAWLFEPKSRPKGSVVKEIKFDADYAGFRSGFDEVAIGTHNSYAKIANRLEGLQ